MCMLIRTNEINNRNYDKGEPGKEWNKYKKYTLGFFNQ